MIEKARYSLPRNICFADFSDKSISPITNIQQNEILKSDQTSMYTPLETKQKTGQ